MAKPARFSSIEMRWERGLPTSAHDAALARIGKADRLRIRSVPWVQFHNQCRLPLTEATFSRSIG
jgi:hypothetical protein